MALSDRIEAIEARWETFAAKVRTRVEEVLGEADAGFDELIATEVLDPAPLASALTEFRSRMLGLGRKVDEAWEKLDRDLDAAMDSAEGPGVAAVAKLRDDLLRRVGALREHITVAEEEMSVRKSAAGARALGEKAKAEMERLNGGRKCSACGGPIRPDVLHEPTTVVCGHCKAVNSVHPGPATALFFGGGAAHSLAQEACLKEAAALRSAEKRYRGYRHPTDADAKRYLDVALSYWRAYAKAFLGMMSEGAPEQVEATAKAKLGPLRAMLKDGALARAVLTRALAAASAGDAAGVQGALEDEECRTSLAELVEAAHEHADRPATDLLLSLQHHEEAADEPVARWKAERLRELDRELKGRVR